MLQDSLDKWFQLQAFPYKRNQQNSAWVWLHPQYQSFPILLFVWKWTTIITNRIRMPTSVPSTKTCILSSTSRTSAQPSKAFSVSPTSSNPETNYNWQFIWRLVYSALGIIAALLKIICLILNWSFIYYTWIIEGLLQWSDPKHWQDLPSKNYLRVPTVVGPNIHFSSANGQLDLTPHIQHFFLNRRSIHQFQICPSIL